MESPSDQLDFHKIEVLYLLSQGNEEADHPHMIQVQYPSHQQAPTLRDVKSRLTALRGRGMPDSYSWSYKRRYKGAFIWCDVFDDDVILPLGQSGEYVLKALEVFDASQDALDQEVDQFCQRLVSSVTREVPENVYRAPVPTAKQERPQSAAEHSVGNARNGASNNCSKQLSMGGPTHNGIASKVCGSVRSDDYSTDARSTSVSEDFIENKRCLEKSKGSDSSTSMSGTNRNTGYQAESCDISDENSDVSSFERDVKTETKELPSGPVMRSTDQGEASSLPFASSGFSRKEPVKSRTWKVKEEENPVPSTNGRTSRRHSDEFYEREVVVGRRDIPSSPVARPCFPGDPFMFMLKKAVRFHRSQLCRKVEVVERFRALPVEEPSFSRFTSTTRFGAGSKNVSRKPHFSKVVTLKSKPKSKPQRNQISSEEPEREARTLSEFLETTKIRSTSQRTDNDGARKSGSARHIRSASNDAYGTARCREVVIVSEAVLLPERLQRENEKSMSDLKSKRLLVKPDMKSCKVVTKSAMRQSSKPGAEPSSPLFNPASAHALQLPTCTASRPQDITEERALKHQRSLVAEFVDTPTGETSIACEDFAVKTQPDLKNLKVPRNVSYFNLPVPGAEKRTSDTKIYPTRESSVFGSAALYSDNSQEVKLVHPKLKVLAIPTTETSFLEGESMRAKESPSKHKSHKAREERPLTPGLTELHWESLLEEAVVHNQPPKGLVLHECFQCGRTFKPDSLKVHLRGCHVINKPKPSVVLNKRVSL